MAPSNAIIERIKKSFKRVPTWFRKKTTPGKSAAPSNKVSLPEQPKEELQQPTKPQDKSSVAKASTMPTLQIALQNQTTSGDVYAYISKIMLEFIEQENELNRHSWPSHRQQQLTLPSIRRRQNGILPSFSVIYRPGFG